MGKKDKCVIFEMYRLSVPSHLCKPPPPRFSGYCLVVGEVWWWICEPIFFGLHQWSLRQIFHNVKDWSLTHLQENYINCCAELWSSSLSQHLIIARSKPVNHHPDVRHAHVLNRIFFCIYIFQWFLTEGSKHCKMKCLELGKEFQRFT